MRISGTLRSNNGDLLRAAALAGVGVILTPSFIVACDVAEGRLEPVLAEACAPGGDIQAVYPPGRYMPAKLRAFVDFLAARFDDDPSREAGLPPPAATR